MKKEIALSKDNAIIKPARSKGEPFIGPDAIIVTIPSELQFMATKNHAQRERLKTLSPFKLFTIQNNCTLPVALAGPVLGAPQGVILMEKLIAIGAKRIWILGWCGSLQSDLLIGDLVIPTSAFPEEGTSRHYPVGRKKLETSAVLKTKLKSMLAKTYIPFREGPVWTTDALYRETENKVLAYGKKGYLAVEMEMSALIRVAAYRSIDIAALLVVSDELFDLRWHNGFGAERLKRRSREAAGILLDLCLQYNSSDYDMCDIDCQKIESKMRKL